MYVNQRLKIEFRVSDGYNLVIEFIIPTFIEG